MLRRGLSAGAVALIVALGGTATASACDSASISATPSAASGDTVSYTIGGVLSGAVWTVYVNGAQVAGPTTSDGAIVHGTFSMPPRQGSAAGVSIELKIDHDDFTTEDAEGTKNTSVAYKVAAAPAPEATNGPAPSPPQQPAAAQSTGSHPTTNGAPGPGPGGSNSTAGPRGPRPSAPPQHAARRTLAERPAERGGAGRAAVPAAAQPRSVAAPIATAAAPAGEARHGARPEHAVRAQPRATEAPQRAVTVVPRAQPVTAVSGSVPLRDLLAGGAAVVLLSLLALLWRRRAEPGGAPAVPVPPEPDRFDAIEAELQTLLAEEKERERVAVGARDG